MQPFIFASFKILHKSMHIELIGAIVLIIGVSFLYVFFISPAKLVKKYQKAFEQRGYKVFCFPYKAFTYPIIQTIYRDSLNGDAFYSYKNVFSNYDVLIGNQLYRPSISLFHPDLRKQFAKAERDQVYEKLKDFAKQQVRFAGYGLIFSEGEDWKRKRRIMGSLFTYDFIKENLAEIEKTSSQVIQKVEKTSVRNEEQKVYQYDLGDMASTIFSEVIVSLFMGLKSLNQNINGVPVGRFIMQLANDANMQAKGLLPLIFGIRFLDWGLTKKHRQVNKRLRIFNEWVNKFIDNQIAQRNNKKQISPGSKQGKNILSIHLKAKQTSAIEQNFYDRQELIAELKNFAIAGTDTSVGFFRMMVYYVSKSPQAEQKLRCQIQNIIGNQEITFQGLKKLKYLQAIQKQTTRLFGPTNFNFPRRVLKDHYIDGIPIRKETIIQYHTVCTHYNSKYYQSPHQFRPERWLNCPEEDKNSALLIGFGLGPRNCIGQNLASIQSKIAMVKFYQRYKKIQVKKEKLNFKWKFLYKPDEFNVIVTKK